MRGLRGPGELGESCQPRERHELDVVAGADRLRPHRALDPGDLVLRHAVDQRGRIPFVSVLDLDQPGPVLAERGRFGVLHVEVRVIRRRHQDLVAARRRAGDVRVGSAEVPVLGDGRGRGRGLGDFVPAGDLLAVLGDDRLNLAFERQVVGRRRRMRLVAAEVEVRPGRDRRDFADHVVEELVRDRLAHAERAEADIGAGVQRRRDAVAVQLRVRRQRGVDVSWHVDLGHDGDVPRSRVRHDVLVLLLRVVAARVTVDRGAAAEGGQTRPALDLDAPALVVGQVQVQCVDLVLGDLVDVQLDLVRLEEMPRDVEHRPAAGEARVVEDRAAGDRPRPVLHVLRVDCRWQ